MKKHTEFVKGMRMNRKRFARAVAVAAGFFFLCTALESARGQSNTPSPESTPGKPAPMGRTQRVPSKGDDFAGVKFTDEQQAKIDEIHRRMASRKDVVVKSRTLQADQKDAMVAGLGRMERGEIIKLLTPEQQKEVLKKARSAQAAAREDKKQSSQ